MRQKSMIKKAPAEEAVRNIRRNRPFWKAKPVAHDFELHCLVHIIHWHTGLASNGQATRVRFPPGPGLP
jgi:hypothetical protein